MILSTAAAFITFNLFGFGGVAVNFDNLKPGTLPPFWTVTATRPVQPVRWEIRLDSTAPSRSNVFAQIAEGASNSEFPLAVFDKVMCHDGDLSVKFKITTNARRNKTAGIVWRYQDPMNYYLLDFGVDESNIALYHVQNGQLRPISIPGTKQTGPGMRHELKAGQWYAAKVIFRGNTFKVLFGNRQLFEAADKGLDAPGKTGLWTRGGTVAAFDDFRIDKKG